MRFKVTGNASVGVMFELVFASKPVGSLTIAPYEKEYPASISDVELKAPVTCATKDRPGEFVLVVETPGRGELVNNPPGSMVGMLSCRYRPNTLQLEVKLWSTRINSWRWLNVLDSGVNSWCVAGFVGSGIFDHIALMYCAAIGLMAATVLVTTPPVQAAVLLGCTQMGLTNVPCFSAAVGTSAVTVALVFTLRNSWEKKKNVFFS